MKPYRKGCPKCGSQRGYLVNVRLMGSVVHRGHWDIPGGAEHVVNNTGLRAVADKTVRCVECGRRTLLKTIRARHDG